MANTPRFCPKCGLPVEDGARFCQGCGEKLPALRAALMEPDTTPRKGKTDSKPFLIGCGVLAVIGIIFTICAATVFFYRFVTGGLPLRIIAPTPAPAVVEATLPVAVQDASPTAAPTSAPTSVPTTAPLPTLTPNVIYEGIRLSYDPAVASGSTAQTVPAVTASDQVAPWDVAPQHVEMVFSGYALRDTFHTPALYVYPVDEYARSSETAGQIIADLRKMLAEKPPAADHVPFLPIWNAGPIMHARLAYLDFKNGSGVRILTQYAQAIYPINNQSLFYTFQGLTDDGKYYVSFVLPISHPALPATGELSASEYSSLESSFQSYIQGVVQLLDSQPPQSFTPDVGKLDEMVQSLEVK